VAGCIVELQAASLEVIARKLESNSGSAVLIFPLHQGYQDPIMGSWQYRPMHWQSFSYALCGQINCFVGSDKYEPPTVSHHISALRKHCCCSSARLDSTVPRLEH